MGGGGAGDGAPSAGAPASPYSPLRKGLRARLPIMVIAMAVAASACSGARSTAATPTAEPTLPQTSTSVPPPAPTTTTTTAATTTAATTADTTPPTSAPTVEIAELGFGTDERLARMGADLDVLLANGPREAGTDEEGLAAAFLKRELAKLFDTVSTEPVPLPNGRVSENVWVSVGDGPVDVLLGAHYDTKQVSPGADDNGSGVVVLLEMARRQAAEPQPGVRTTFVFFGAEEVLEGYDSANHHFGSRLHAAGLEAAGSLPDHMVSVDQVGQDPNVVAALYEDGDSLTADLLVRAGMEVAVVDPSRPAIEVDVIRRGDISDHEAFARRGVPSVFLWRPDNPGWHNENDTIVVPERLIENLALLEQALATFATG